MHLQAPRKLRQGGLVEAPQEAFVASLIAPYNAYIKCQYQLASVIDELELE